MGARGQCHVRDIECHRAGGAKRLLVVNGHTFDAQIPTDQLPDPAFTGVQHPAARRPARDHLDGVRINAGVGQRLAPSLAP
jgi:hypothetical protein